MENEKRLIIIDGHSLLYRAFHALPPLSDKQGRLTNAVYGFLLILFRAIKDTRAHYLVACFDTKKPTFRHEQFIEYKAHRPEMPSGIAAQIPIIKEVLASLAVPIFEKDGFEADDLIATIAKKAKLDTDVVILSGDLDNLQLVDESVSVYTMGKGIKESVVYGPAEVLERYGVNPSQMNDFKALTGDNSDNIPGVPGIGKTTAADLISRYGSIENLYAELATDTVVAKPKVKEALRQHKQSALLSLQLVSAKTDVEVDFRLEDCRFGNFEQSGAKAMFESLGFNSLLERLSTIAR